MAPRSSPADRHPATTRTQQPRHRLRVVAMSDRPGPRRRPCDRSRTPSPTAPRWAQPALRPRARSIAALTMCSLIPSIWTNLSRDVAPKTTLTSEGRTPSSRANNRHSARFAFPSTGRSSDARKQDAVTHTSNFVAAGASVETYGDSGDGHSGQDSTLVATDARDPAAYLTEKVHAALDVVATTAPRVASCSRRTVVLMGTLSSTTSIRGSRPRAGRESRRRIRSHGCRRDVVGTGSGEAAPPTGGHRRRRP